ncbi:MAG: hypothetical protein QMD05_06005 [Candidatus Brocadiaceae bacterium]|nr:hypothetical protein [Candidatus Brocadiaceae bacterium]
MAAKKGQEILVVASKVREYIKSKGCLTAGELVPALSSKLHCCIDAAIARAKGNGRKTVNAKDV